MVIEHWWPRSDLEIDSETLSTTALNWLIEPSLLIGPETVVAPHHRPAIHSPKHGSYRRPGDIVACLHSNVVEVLARFWTGFATKRVQNRTPTRGSTREPVGIR
jgi:hypothetical protein